MHKSGISLLSILFVFAWVQLNPLVAETKDPKIHVVPVEGTVEPGMAAFIRRSLKEIRETDPDALVVFKLDTFGGRVDSALEIVEMISEIPQGKSVSYVEKKAISAGALIALAGNVLVMKENTLIGDCAPIIQTSEGQKEVGEKTQTVLRAQFRTLAKKNGYPEVLAESMVTKTMEVYRVTRDGQTRYMDKTEFDDLTEAEQQQISEKRTVVAKGELLTMDDKEARDLGFSRASVTSLENALDVLGYADYERIDMIETWSENLVRLLQPLLPVLMLVGIGALYTELKAPGFGLPGMIGILCLSLVLFNQYLVGLADYTELLLLIIGCLLMAAEMFVLPGFGIAGMAGILVLAAGLVLSFQGFVMPDPDMPWEGRLMVKNLAMVLGSFAGALAVSLLMVRFVLPQFSKVVKGPYLEADLSDSRAASEESKTVSPGDEGIALTALRPSGKVKIGQRKIDAVSRGQFIARGIRVIVDAVEHNHVIVRPGE